MTNTLPSPEFEAKVRAASAVPGPDAAFMQRLRTQLLTRNPEARPQPKRLSRRLTWAVALGAALLILGALFFAIGPRRVANAMKQLFGFVPGVGVVEQSVPLRVLAAPVAATRQGVTLTVEQAVLSPDKTVILFTIEGVPAEAFSKNENIPGCIDSAGLRLPDGNRLSVTGGEGRGWGSGSQTRFVYPAMAAGVTEATLVLPCISNTLPGKAPENWEIPLRFVDAPPDMTMMPVIEISPAPPTIEITPASATSPAGETPTETLQPSLHQSTPATAAAPTEAALPSPYGIGLALDKFIPLDDGYYLMGHTSWTDHRIASAGPGAWAMKLLDAQGQEIPIEPANFSEVGIDQPGPSQWLYHIYGKVFNSPLTLLTTLAEVELQEPVSVTLDLRPYGYSDSGEQTGRTWKIQPVPFNVLDMQAAVVQVTSMKQGDLNGFEIALEADPALRSLPLGIVSGAIGAHAGGGGSSRDDKLGLVLVYVLSDGKIGFPLTLGTSSASLSGRWETTWNPPMVESPATPTPVAQACLTLDKWKQAAAHPAPLPSALDGRLVVYGRIKDDHLGPSPDNYGVFAADLDGGHKQILGQGTWPSLALDGTRAVYSGSDGLRLADLASGEARTLPGTTSTDYDPRWSPDGAQIAFSRVNNLYRINADGSDLQRLPTGPGYAQAVGWSADGSRLYYAVADEGGQSIRSIDLATGTVYEGFVIKSKGASASLSPDGHRLAFVERVPGKLGGGLYITRTDGTERRLVAQLDYWQVSNPVWSPDGKWLLVSVMDADQFAPASQPTLINLDTCQAIPLEDLEGDVFGWAP